MILFLDDDPYRAALAYQRWPEDKKSNTIWTRTAEEAIDVLRDYELSEAHLDHDLGGEHFVNSAREDCGMEIVRWLESRPTAELQKFLTCKFTVHSWNIPAGREMTERLTKLGLKATQTPFGM